MRLKEIPGKKNSQDRILLVATAGEEQITFKQILFMLKFFFENEDRCYPHGKGRRYLLLAIRDYAMGSPWKW